MTNCAQAGPASCLAILLVLLSGSLLSCSSDGFIGVVYVRPMTAEERKLDHIDSLDYRIKGSITLEEARAIYRAEEPPEDIIKVELVDTDPEDGFRELRLYSTQRGYRQIHWEERWLEDHKDSFTLTVDHMVYRTTNMQLRLLDSVGSVYYPDMGPEDRVGQFWQEFECVQGGQQWSMVVYDTTPFPVTTHEMLRLSSEGAQPEKQQTPIGMVLTSRSSQHGEQKQWVGAMWISGEHYIVIVIGQDVDLSEIIAAVGKQYPSSLSATANVDMTQWGQQEIDMRLDQMIRETASDMRDPVQWAQQLLKIARYVSISAIVDLDTIVDIDWQMREQINQDLVNWWRSHREKMQWDQSRRILVDEQEIE